MLFTGADADPVRERPGFAAPDLSAAAGRESVDAAVVALPDAAVGDVEVSLAVEAEMVRCPDRRIAPAVLGARAVRGEALDAAVDRVGRVHVPARVERQPEREATGCPIELRLCRIARDPVDLAGLSPGPDRPVGSRGHTLRMVETVDHDHRVSEPVRHES